MPALPATPPPVIQSWADHDHAWRAADQGVEATSDGGRHWRVVFRVGPGGAVAVNSLLRTSATAGVIGIDTAGAFVTNDAGRHWVQLAGNGPELGRGSEAYAAEANVLVRVEWPPRASSSGDRTTASRIRPDVRRAALRQAASTHRCRASECRGTTGECLCAD